MASYVDIPPVIDIEASAIGLGSYPIEVGFVQADGAAFCTLIKPATTWQRWDVSAERIHGIQRDQLFEHGRAISEVAQLLNQRLEGQTVYSDAWGNDCCWLGLLFECAGCRQRFRLESLRALMTEEQASLWHAVKDQVILELGLTRHRASMDARILQLTYLRTRERVEAAIGSTLPY